jgi:hypothetical protein
MLELLLNLYNFIFPEHNGIIYGVLDPLTIGLIMGGVKAAAGGIQALTAGKRQAEPKYEIPQEVFQATQRAQEMAQTGMPEASRMQASQAALQSAVLLGRGAQDRRAGLAMAGNIQAGLDRTNLAVAAQDASMRLQNQRFAQQALMTQAQYRDKAFANQWQSWMNREQQRRANVGAGLQNIMGGLDMAGSMYAMSLYNKDNTTKDTTTNTTNTATGSNSFQSTNDLATQQRLANQQTALSNIGSAFASTPTGRALLGIPQGMTVSGEFTNRIFGTQALGLLPRLLNF